MSTTLKQLLRKPKVVIPIAVVAVLAIVALISIASKSNDSVKAAPRPLDVEVVQVKQDDVPLYSEWIGTTEGIVNADIKGQVSGYLLRQDYKEGSFVKKGELLFEIDPRPFQAVLDQANGQLAQFEGQLEQANSQVVQAEAQVAQADSQVLQAQAQLAQSEANLVKTQLDVNKYAPLAEQKAVTQQDYDNAVQANKVAQAQVEASKAGIESARAQLRAANAQIGTAKAATSTANGQIENAKAAVRTAQLNLGFTRIVSPIDGIAGLAQTQVGDLVQPNNPNSPLLTTVSTVDPIKVYFTISEQQYLAFTKENLIQARQGASVAQIELELILVMALLGITSLALGLLVSVSVNTSEKTLPLLIVLSAGAEPARPERASAAVQWIVTLPLYQPAGFGLVVGTPLSVGATLSMLMLPTVALELLSALSTAVPVTD